MWAHQSSSMLLQPHEYFLGYLQLWKLHHPSPMTLVFVVLFPSRGERIEGGAESFIPEPPEGKQLYSQVQFFYRCDLCAVVLTESWRWPHQSIFHDFRTKVEWKVKLHIEF